MTKTGDSHFAQLELDLIRSMSSNFFPQSYKNVNFTVKWFDNMAKYMTVLAAGYIDLMKAGIPYSYKFSRGQMFAHFCAEPLNCEILLHAFFYKKPFYKKLVLKKPKC